MAIDDFSLETKTATLRASSWQKLIETAQNVLKPKRLKKLAMLKSSASLITFSNIIDHFEKELGPDGQWKAWSPAYETSQEERGKGGNKILQDTGALRQSFAPTDKASGSRVGKGSIIWFNNAKTKDGFPYAWHHDTGGKSKKNKREFMWLSDKALEKIGKIFLDAAIDPNKN